ncbi:MAG TPA: hypothetical protein HA250_02590 [Nanoarchaeota archaeon]|nr:hypothetical protein [Nanoarchaeota archaeon]HIH34795.1 hypothetical protein [Nanoarchaeota archaeon]HIH51225.1 hypothetical protein [Nanoarchaeota archaeon]
MAKAHRLRENYRKKGLSLLEKLKRYWKIFSHSADLLLTLIFIFIIVLLASYLLAGFLEIANREMNEGTIDFVKYLTLLSFTLAGFTFLSGSLNRNKIKDISNVEISIFSISSVFILSGFFGLVFIALTYLNPINVFGLPIENFEFMKTKVYPISIMFSILFFLAALAYLMIILRVWLPHIERQRQKKIKSKSFKEALSVQKAFWKEQIGLD